MKFRKDDKEANPPDESTTEKAVKDANTDSSREREPQPGPHRTSNEQTPALPQPGERTEAPKRAPTQRVRATSTVLYQGLPYYEGQEFNAQMPDVQRLRERYNVELVDAKK